MEEYIIDNAISDTCFARKREISKSSVWAEAFGYTRSLSTSGSMELMNHNKNEGSN